MTTMRPNGVPETVQTFAPSGTIPVVSNGNVYKAQGIAMGNGITINTEG